MQREELGSVIVNVKHGNLVDAMKSAVEDRIEDFEYEVDS